MRRLLALQPASLVLMALLTLADGRSMVLPFAPTPLAATPLTAAPPIQAAQQPERSDPAVRRSRYVTVSLDRMPVPDTRPDKMGEAGVPIRLDLFDDVSVDLVFVRFDPNPRGTTWVGRVAGARDSHVTLVYGDRLMTGSVVVGDATYAIRPAPERERTATAQGTGILHIVREIDQAGFRREAEPIEPEFRTTRERRAIEMAADGDGYVDPPDLLDLLLVYTSGAVAHAGGTAALLNLVTLGVAETNASYEASDVLQRLSLVHVAAVAHADHADTTQTLDDLAAGRGAFGGVAALRDTWAADLVMLVQFSSSAVCGLAYQMTWPSVTFQSSAFSVVEADCISPNYTFAHELGHNMGLRHDWYIDSGTLPYTYAHGHVSTDHGNRWRTIMSYADLCVATGAGCPRLLAWSNPDVFYNGAPMGVPSGTKANCTTGSLSANTCDADDAQVLNQTAVHVANFRHAIPGPFAVTTPATGQVVHPAPLALAWSSSLRAATYEYCYDTVDNNACDTGWIPVGDATSALIADPGPALTYHWQVRAVNAAGTVEAGGGTWSSFLTGPAPGVDFARDGSFDAGLDHWRLYATPDMSYIVANAAAGAVQFYRVASIDSTPNQAVVFQQTGTPLVADTTVEIRFELGNSDTVRKRISLVAHDADFSDLAVCTFWLPPQTPLAGYVMRAHTTQPWTDTSISFYAASSGSQGGFYQIDNVSIRYAPALPATRTDCVDPFAPEGGSGPDSANLITNGTFAADSLASWDMWGTIERQVVAGVVQMVRPTAGTPAGVLLQRTGVALAAGDILTASFQLGNSSAVRKRVTAVLHDSDFSDLSACTFWLPPGQPLAPHVYRTYATQPWTNATLSIYPATVGADEWILFDNATLQLTPGASIIGTECLEPAMDPDAPVTESNGDARVPGSTTYAAPFAVADTWRSDGFVWSSDGTSWASVLPPSGSRHTLEWKAPLDLPDTETTHIIFESWFEAPDARAWVEVSVDDVTWVTAADIDQSQTWTPVVVDLAPWAGRRLHVRFVIDGSDRSDQPGRWQIRDLRVTSGG